jgi:large subunit ribosomal protein L22
MVNKTNQENEHVANEHVAVAKVSSASISTKHSVEISNAIRNKNTAVVKSFLENVINLKEAVPFKRYKRDVGHKKNMASGRYPQKAAKEFLKLVKSVEANAQVKGLDTSNLKIVKMVSNIASIPFSGGRRRRGTKRTNIEIMVKEGSVKSKVAKKTDDSKNTQKKESPVNESKPNSNEKEIKEKLDSSKDNIKENVKVVSKENSAKPTVDSVADKVQKAEETLEVKQ